MSISSSSRGRRGLPRGPHGLTPSEVAQSQRERLLAAMTEAVAERGYTATPVADVIQRAGVSRKTFYAHFKDRRDCLIAAYELAASITLSSCRVAAEGARGEGRLQAVISALCAAAAESPAACRLQVVEIAAAGQTALLAREQMVLSIGALLGSGLEPPSSAPPDSVLGLIAGGMLGVIEQRATDEQLRNPGELARELARWTRSYHPFPDAPAGWDDLPVDADRMLLAHAGSGGRAPGTLSLAPMRVVEGARAVSPSFTAHSQRERILDAVANLCAQRGYVGLTVDQIAAMASVSLNTFYEHFKDKEDAFLVAQELGHMRGTAILEQALSRAPAWDVGVRDGIAALLGFFASEQSFARLAAVEAPIATPQAAARSRAHLAAYAQMLLDGAPRGRRPAAVTQDAIAAGLHAALFGFALHRKIENPRQAHSYASYLALAPFLGPGRALVP